MPPFSTLPADATIKTLVYWLPITAFAVALLRGDHDLNEIKLKNSSGMREMQMASERDSCHAPVLRSAFPGRSG